MASDSKAVPGPDTRRVVTSSEEAIRSTFTPSDRHRLIAKDAFIRARLRGFVPGHDVEDWLLAEKEFDAAAGLTEPAPRWDLA